jgi:2-isopropylmalate synthase
MYAQGVEPELNLSNMPEIAELYERVTRMQVYDRQPYAGKLVFAAFSGSHQDAIAKGMKWREEKNCDTWTVPYLPIDPKDVGRSYDPIIRINSQSGKGGVAYILEQYYGLFLPKGVQQAFSVIVTKLSDQRQSDLQPEEIHQLFLDTYVNRNQPIDLKSYREEMLDDQTVQMTATLLVNGQPVDIAGTGNGLLDAFCQGLQKYLQIPMEITAYHEHALERGSTSKAITYVQLQNGGTDRYIGAGISSSISKSSLRAILSAVNQMPSVKPEP